MTLRTRLLVIFAVAVAGSVAVVEWAVAGSTRQAFERVEAEHINALVAQFRREFAARGDEIARQVQSLAASEALLNVAIHMNRPDADASPYVNEAAALAATHNLALVEIVAEDGTIISSAQWPARFGYKEDWLPAAAERPGAFLKREELPEEAAVALVAVATVRAGDRRLFVAGGQLLDRGFVASLALPAGMRALLYRDGGSVVDASGPLAHTTPLAGLLDEVRRGRREVSRTVNWSGDEASAETIHALPLFGADDDLLGILLVGSSRHELVVLERSLRRTGLVVSTAGVLLGLLLAWWATARVTRPVMQLAAGARQVAAGNWDARVAVSTGGEIGELAAAFNRMIEELAAQRDRVVQAERVAAWRELARRLAHELKNPLFPLQITVENMRRARELGAEEFDEVFREGTATLLAELGNLKQIVGRFSDFARMPPPELEPVDLNEQARATLKLLAAQMEHAGIAAVADLDPQLGAIEADPDQMTRVWQNLVLNAIDAMPGGGTLTLRTRRIEGGARVEVSDTGQGLSEEERARLFTPYYTTKKHGTGLGLAIVQSVVADHKGRITVESAPGRGTTFRIELDGGVQ
jgi:signal transduction histidine kinase